MESPVLTDEDPIAFQIRQEVEEFLRDLTMEFPFPEIFEILRQHEFHARFGHKVSPFPSRKLQKEALAEIKIRIRDFLAQLEKAYGSRNADAIKRAMSFYTVTTVEDEGHGLPS